VRRVLNKEDESIDVQAPKLGMFTAVQPALWMSLPKSYHQLCFDTGASGVQRLIRMGAVSCYQST
jgi:hypothetical protein